MNQCTVLSRAASWLPQGSHCLLLKTFSQFRVNTPVQTEGSFQLWTAFSSLFLLFNVSALGFCAFLWSSVASFQKRPVEVILSSLWKALHKVVTTDWRKPVLSYINKCCPFSGFIYLHHILLFSFFKSSFNTSSIPWQHTISPPYFKLKQCTFVPCPYTGLHSISFPCFVCMCFLCSCFWNHALLPSSPWSRGALVTNDSTYYRCFLNPLRTDTRLKWEQHPQELKDIFPCIIYG